MLARWLAVRPIRQALRFLHRPRPRADLRAGLARAMQEGKLDEWLEGLAPNDDNYRRLSQAPPAPEVEQWASRADP
jgi:hypothetical protein